MGLTESEAAEIIRQVSDALAYCHNLNIVHRDLKPENLLFETNADDSPIKIIDFGLSQEMQGGLMMTPCGTPGYVAPEILNRIPYGKAVDIWSLGVITYTLLCGFPPFYDESNELPPLYDKIRNARYDFPSPYWDHVSKEAKNIVQCMLTLDTTKRITAAQIGQHAWTSGNASKVAMPASTVRGLKSFQYRRRLKRAVNTILAVKKLIALLQMSEEDPNGPPKEQQEEEEQDLAITERQSLVSG